MTMLIIFLLNFLILLKNDFHRNTKLGIPELYSCKSLQKHVVSIFYGDVKSKELIWSLGDTDDVFIICTYVHDLQHLFKLLRIISLREKQSENIKLK